MIIKDKFVPLDLEPYFNADGISFDFNRSDGTFGISSYPAEQLPGSKEIVWVEGIPFIFPPKEDCMMNNIECNNQKIKVQPDKYNNIYVLGSCDNGSFEERVVLAYDKQNVTKKLNLSGWILHKPMYNEKLAFKVDHLHKSNCDILDISAYIWMQTIQLSDDQNLLEIALPDNICLHIFAITLQRGGEI